VCFTGEGVLMSISLYDISVPAIVRGLTSLSGFLDKATAYAETRKFDSRALLDARLYPDMYPLLKQVQVVCDIAKGTVARLAEVEVPKHEDNETTVAELKARIAKTMDFVKTIKPSQLQNGEGKTITMKFPNMTVTFTGLSYLTDFSLPNFYFHMAMAYGLLRHNGLELGKRDFIGAV
jgi:uncharacterized protein